MRDPFAEDECRQYPSSSQDGGDDELGEALDRQIAVSGDRVEPDEPQTARRRVAQQRSTRTSACPKVQAVRT